MDNNTLNDIAERMAQASSVFPYAEEMRDLAKRVFEDISSSNMDTLEEAGRASLGILLQLYADGAMQPEAAMKFLNTLAEKKTPPPIQRIQQKTETDMRILISDAVGDNPDKLAATIALANQRKEEIKAKLKIGDSLMLDAPLEDEEESQQEDYILEDDPEIRKLVNEPNEIHRMRFPKETEANDRLSEVNSTFGGYFRSKS